MVILCLQYGQDGVSKGAVNKRFKIDIIMDIQFWRIDVFCPFQTESKI